MEALKPCPFCGKEQLEIENQDGDILVSCDNPKCDFRDSGLFMSSASWNRRPIEDALRAEIAILRQRLESALEDHQSIEVTLRDIYGWEETAGIDTVERLSCAVRRLACADRKEIAALEAKVQRLEERLEYRRCENMDLLAEGKRVGEWLEESKARERESYTQMIGLAEKVQRLKAVRAAAEKVLHSVIPMPLALKALGEALQAASSDEPATSYGVAVNGTGSDEQRADK